MNKSNDGPGSIKMASMIMKKYGLGKLFLGWKPTLLREMAGLSVYFGSYHYIFDMLIHRFGFDLINGSFQAGGLAGLLGWAIAYPVHYIKVKIQCDDLENPKYRSATQCAK